MPASLKLETVNIPLFTMRECEALPTVLETADDWADESTL
jgi:hypothetical protein